MFFIIRKVKYKLVFYLGNFFLKIPMVFSGYDESTFLNEDKQFAIFCIQSGQFYLYPDPVG
jgi:hypothetical protein